MRRRLHKRPPPGPRSCVLCGHVSECDSKQRAHTVHITDSEVLPLLCRKCAAETGTPILKEKAEKRYEGGAGHEWNYHGSKRDDV